MTGDEVLESLAEEVGAPLKSKESDLPYDPSKDQESFLRTSTR